MEKILVATDGSENSKKALLEARKLAECLDAKVDIINVTKDVVTRPFMAVNQYNKETMRELKGVGKEVLDDALDVFKGFKREVNVIMKSGNAADEIIDVAEEGDYDLIIIGSRGLGTFSRAILGSVSNKVLNHVKIDVWVVR